LACFFIIQRPARSLSCAVCVPRTLNECKQQHSCFMHNFTRNVSHSLLTNLSSPATRACGISFKSKSFIHSCCHFKVTKQQASGNNDKDFYFHAMLSNNASREVLSETIVSCGTLPLVACCCCPSACVYLYNLPFSSVH